MFRREPQPLGPVPLELAGTPPSEPCGPVARRWAWLAGGVFFVAIFSFFLRDSLFFGKGLVPCDTVLTSLPWAGRSGEPALKPSNSLLEDQSRIFVPQHEFVWQSLLKGQCPFWNSCRDCGAPDLGSMQGALLFPLQLLLAPISPFRASGLAALMKLLLAAGFMALYVRSLGLSRPASLVSGLVFGLSAFMVVWLGHPHVNVAIWLPLLLYFIESNLKLTEAKVVSGLSPDSHGIAFGRVGSQPSVRRWVGFALACACLLLGGHPPTAIHCLLFVTVYFAFRLFEPARLQRRQHAVAFALSLLAGLLLAAPQWLPFLEYYRLSSSSLSSAALARGNNHLGLNTLISFVLPFFAGSPTRGCADLSRLLGLEPMVNFGERTGYVGVLTLFLALAALLLRRCKIARFYALIVFGCLLVVYGCPPFPALLGRLPLLANVNHARLLLLAGFGLAVLAGLGLDELVKGISQGRGGLVLAVFFGLAGVPLAWFGFLVATRASSLDLAHRQFLLRQLPLVLGGIFTAGIIVALVKSRARHWIIYSLALLWTSVDLLSFGSGYNPAVARERYYPTTAALEFLKKDSSLHRILGLGNVLPPNTAQIYGLQDVRGIDFMTVRRYEELISGRAGNFVFYNDPVELPPVFPLLNVKYLLVPREAVVNAAEFERVFTGEIAVYQYKEVLNRALAVCDYQVVSEPGKLLSAVQNGLFDPQATVLLEEEPQGSTAAAGQPASETNVIVRSYQPGEVICEAALPRKGFLVLLDTWFPGWRASVNGQETRIYRANYAFRAVALPAGKSVIRFRYAPSSFRLGLVCAGLTGVLLAVCWCGLGRRNVSGQARFV